MLRYVTTLQSLIGIFSALISPLIQNILKRMYIKMNSLVAMNFEAKCMYTTCLLYVCFMGLGMLQQLPVFTFFGKVMFYQKSNHFIFKLQFIHQCHFHILIYTSVKSTVSSPCISLSDFRFWQTVHSIHVLTQLFQNLHGYRVWITKGHGEFQPIK